MLNFKSKVQDREELVCEKLKKLITEYKELEAEIKELKDEVVYLRQEPCKRYGIDLSWRTRRGSVDLPSLASDLGITIEQVDLYRKSDTQYWQVSSY